MSGLPFPAPVSTLLFLTALTFSATAREPRLDPPPASLADPAAFTQWVSGVESAIPASAAKRGPADVLWLAGDIPDWRGIKFGEGRESGVRHLRIGFTEATAAGSVLARGGGILSVLKPDAPYPGNPADDSQWLTAERLVDGQAATTAVEAEGYALWSLPPGTLTRALRFSHTPTAGDREMAGWLGGVAVLPERMGNVAPQALAQSAARDDVSAKLVDENNNDQWKTWDNGEQGAALTVSPEHPEFATLTWSAPVRLNGLALLWTGFQAVEIEVFTGAATENPHESADGKWQRIAGKSGMDALYPRPLGVHWIAFPEPLSTRALRLRITGGALSDHGHLTDSKKDGRRVWLGEVLALAPLGDKALTSIVLPKTETEPPPIPIHFTLPEAGLVTLVIEDAQNKRVRNLVSETPFPAGKNTAWWDGSDDLLRDPQAASHGVYHLPARPVAPGRYQVRGLWRKPVSLHYEFSIYNAGKPAWETADKTGCWMTNHTPPTSMAFVPGTRTADGQPLMFMGAFIAEGGHGLQWLREDFTKAGGQNWIGGNWTGAPTLAVDSGPEAVPGHLCYAAATWDGEWRITAKTSRLEDQPVLKFELGRDPKIEHPSDGVKPPELHGFDGGDRVFVLGGIAVHNGTLAGSLVRQNELLFADVKTGQLTRRVPMENPRGLAFDATGRLLVLSGEKLLRFPSAAMDPAQAETLLATGLEDPRQVITDAAGRFYITDRGTSHQVKIFAPDGQLLRTIGKPGAPATGPYDPLHLNNPNGIALDARGRLWIAEADNAPRRVSVWSANGELVRAFYGPTEYGGGGVLDPQDPTRFYYKGLEFQLDWKTGTDTLTRVFHRPDPLLSGHYGPYSPDTPLYPDAVKGQRYFTSCYTHTPTGGDDVVFIWKDTPNTARPAAALGSAHAWPVLRGAEFRPLWPDGTLPDKANPDASRQATFAWSDANGDARPQPGEVRFTKASTRGVTVMNDLSVVVARHGEKSVRFAPLFNAAGLPAYDPANPEILGPAGGSPPSSGGDQALTETGGWTVTTNAPAPFSAAGLGGSWKGGPRWSYPSPWPGLHASHEAAVPDRPGMIIGHTRLLGGWVQPPGGAGPMFGINGNMGNMYLMTADGLFVATLFHDIRVRPQWAAPVALRNMDVTNVSLHDENFWPGITQVADGRVFLVDGARTSLVRVDGLETIQRLPDQTLEVSTGDLDRAREWFARSEAARQKARGSGLLTVPLRPTAPVVDGKLQDWPATTDWAAIDRRGIKANFNSDSQPYDVSAAVTVSGGRLFAAWRTTEKNLLSNSGETPDALFKTGGCLDLMLGTDPHADPDRPAPVPGDQRLLITVIKGQPRALLYRAKVPGTARPVAFSSPWRTLFLDAVEDVTAQLSFAADGAGNFEISLPLTTLHWQPEAGQTFRADLGILRGADGHTTQRIYWSNKATAITADVPSEAELTPKLWGKWRIQAD